LKRLRKSLLFPETFEEENKQASPIETHEKNNPTNLRKNCG
jgi:hypothetical protein